MTKVDNITEPIIHVDKLKRVFAADKETKVAVDEISFDVYKGEIFGILGPNGAGKTTTVKMLSTLLLPTSGEAVVLGYDVSSAKNIHELRKRINVVSGGERGLYYRLTGRQNLHYFADLYNIPRKDQPELINGLIKLVNLTDAADIRVENYSRGMKQRIHIARSLINSPEILFLDEPTIGLDPEMAREMRALVRKLSDEGTTIILTTHYMFEAEELCDRMIIISHGNIVGYGTVAELKKKAFDIDIIRAVTEKDPHAHSDNLERIDGVRSVNTEMVAGRFETSMRVDKGKDVLPAIENELQDLGVRSVGYDEPTLEDTYLHLTEGK